MDRKIKNAEVTIKYCLLCHCISSYYLCDCWAFYFTV